MNTTLTCLVWCSADCRLVKLSSSSWIINVLSTTGGQLWTRLSSNFYQRLFFMKLYPLCLNYNILCQFTSVQLQNQNNTSLSTQKCPHDINYIISSITNDFIKLIYWFYIHSGCVKQQPDGRVTNSWGSTKKTTQNQTGFSQNLLFTKVWQVSLRHYNYLQNR